MRALFFAMWLLAGCRTTHTLEASQQADTELHREVQSGPEHIVMTVEEFSQLCDTPAHAQSDAPVGVDSGPRGWAGAARNGAVGIPAPPLIRRTLVPGIGLSHDSPAQPIGSILTRRTVTVTDRGPSLETLNELSRTQFKLNKIDESKPGGIFSLWFLVGLLPVVAGVLIWRLKPSWFGVAWGALKGLIK